MTVHCYMNLLLFMKALNWSACRVPCRVLPPFLPVGVWMRCQKWHEGIKPKCLPGAPALPPCGSVDALPKMRIVLPHSLTRRGWGGAQCKLPPVYPMKVNSTCFCSKQSAPHGARHAYHQFTCGACRCRASDTAVFLLVWIINA